MDEKIQDRVDRERDSHAENDILSKNFQAQVRFSHLLSYPSRKRLYQYLEKKTSDLNGMTVLDYGCGHGHLSLRYSGSGASKVIGIDISKKFIDLATKQRDGLGVDAALCQFVEMDAHDLKFEDDSFDLVIGYAILHHLDTKLAVKEIYRVLKPCGRVLLLEPLADNPALKLFRWLTPGIRTVDERPFTRSDLVSLFPAEQWDRQLKFCGILEAPLAVLTSIIIPKRVDNFLLRSADRIEKWLHARNMLVSWNQYVLFDCLKRGHDHV